MGLKFSKSNGLIDNSIFDFYIPNSRCGVDICKGATELCIKYCYGNCVLRHTEDPTKQKMGTELTAFENYRITLTDTFVKEMDELIKATNGIKRVRIHSIGEFYNYGYFLKWIEIMLLNPNVQFTAYVKNFEVLAEYKNEGRDIPNNFNVLLSFYPDTYDTYAGKGGKKYVDTLFSELIEYYNAKKYIVCSHQFFKNKVDNPNNKEFFCNGGTEMLCKRYEIKSEDYKNYFVPGQGCGDCLKCYSNDVSPSGSSIYAVLRASSQLANLETFLKHVPKDRFSVLREIFPNEI